MFNTAETYHSDLPLFKKLNLKPFKTVCGEKIHLGKVMIDDDGSYVDIWVEGAPAQFFTFHIYCAESGHKWKVNTGSGTLTQYWSAVKAMAQGCFEVNIIK